MPKLKNTRRQSSTDKLVAGVVQLRRDIEKLPELSAIEKAKLNQDIAVSHLYYSSRIEGTKLTDKQIERAVHGREAI